MNYFFKGFEDELSKLAVSVPTTAWAMARGLTGGIAAGLMAGSMMNMVNRGKPKDQKASVMAPMLSAGAIGTMTGLGKGFAEKGIERSIAKVLTRGKI
jgi:hypothetical protein